MSDQLLSFAAASTQVPTAGSQRCHLYKLDSLATSVSPTRGVPAMVGRAPTRALETEATATAMAATARNVAAAAAPRLRQPPPPTAFSPAAFKKSLTRSFGCIPLMTERPGRPRVFGRLQHRGLLEFLGRIDIGVARQATTDV